MTRRSWIYASLLTALTLGAFVWLFRPKPVAVETATVTRGTFTLTVEQDGVTRVRDRYVVTAPVAGMLMRSQLRAGDAVERGDVIAVIVPNAAQMLDVRTRNELAARVEAAAAEAARARSLLRQAEAAAVQEESDHQRLVELGAGGYASATELERSSLNVELRRKDAEAARFDTDAAEHALEEARAAAREVDALRGGARSREAWLVHAPISGRVLKVREESEGPVTIGAPLLDVADTSRLEARIDVLSTEATRIEPQAYVDLDAGHVHLAGRVRRIEPSGYTKISALGVEEQRVDVIVDLLPTPMALARVSDGYRVDARIEIERQENVLRIPLAALFRAGETWAAYRLTDGRARLVRVRVGSRGSTDATVLDGLKAGDAVIVYPSDAVHDGVRVTAHP